MIAALALTLLVQAMDTPPPPPNLWTCSLANDAGEAHRFDFLILEGSFGDSDGDGLYEVFPHKFRFGAPTLGILDRESDSFFRPHPDKAERLYFSDAKDDPIFFFRYPVFRPDSVDVTLSVMKRGEIRAAAQEQEKGGEVDERRYQFRGRGRCTPIAASVPEGETR